jgi:hypothetical protein
VLSVVIKPYAVIFLPWLVVIGAPSTVAIAAVGLAVALATPVLAYGIPGTIALHQAWWKTVTESTAPNLLNPDNVSVAAMYAKWMGMGRPAAVLAAVTALALVSAAAFVCWRRRDVARPIGLEASLLLTLIPLLSPQGWDYVFLLATPAVMYLINYDSAVRPPLRAVMWGALAVVALSLYDVMGRRTYGAFMNLAVISVCFLVIVAALVSLRVRRIA